MASDTSLVFNLLAKDKTSKAVGTARQNIGKLGTAVVGLGVAAGVGLAKVGGDFDAAFDKIRVGTGAVGSDLEKLKGDFKSALAETPADMETVASAIADLNTMTGATGPVLQELTVGVAEASRMLGEDGAANAKAFGQALQQWQIPAADGRGNLDALFVATQKYGIGLGDLTGHLNNYGSVLQNAGFSMEESAAFFGQLNKAGLKVSRVMPGLNKAFRDWAGEGKDVQKELAGTIKQIEEAESGTEALAIATETFGAEGAQRMTTAVRSGAISLEDLSTVLSGTEGAISETAAGTDSWKEKLAKLKNEGLVAIEPVASAVFDKLGTGVDVFRNLVTWGQNNIGVVKALGFALGGIAATVLVVNAGMKIYHGIQLIIRAATVAWTAVQWLLNAALTANPIGIVVLAIAALVAGIVVAYTKSETFREIVSKAFKAVGAVITWWWEHIVQPYFKAVGTIFKWVIDHVIKPWWEGVKLYFGFWKNLLGNVAGWVKSVWENVQTWFNKIVGFVKNLPSRISSAATGLFDGIKSAFRSALNWIIDKWNGLSFTVGPISMGPFGQLGPWTLGTPNLPRFHEGGVVPGSRGQEQLAILQGGERVLTEEQFRSLLHGSGRSGVLTDEVQTVRENMVRLGDVTEGEWQALKDAGWQGRAGDRMEALYPPLGEAKREFVRLGEVSKGEWNRLLALGWQGQAGDRMEALYPPLDANRRQFVKMGEVSDAEWQKLMEMGWQGIAGDHMEALYPPMRRAAEAFDKLGSGIEIDAARLSPEQVRPTPALNFLSELMLHARKGGKVFEDFTFEGQKFKLPDKQRFALMDMVKALRGGKTVFEDFTFKGMNKKFLLPDEERHALFGPMFRALGLEFTDSSMVFFSDLVKEFQRIGGGSAADFFQDIPLFDKGGHLPPGISVVRNNTGRPERVLAPGQSAGGPTINVYVQGSIRSDRDLIEVIRNEMINGGFRGALEGVA